MSIVNVPVTDNFDQWRQKTNTIATQQGDLNSLNTVDTSSIVNAVNEVNNESLNNAIRMSIALG